MTPARELSATDQSQEDRIKKLEEQQEEILNLLRPISETYTTVSTLGKWLMAFMVFVSILLGVILSAKSIVK